MARVDASIGPRDQEQDADGEDDELVGSRVLGSAGRRDAGVPRKIGTTSAFTQDLTKMAVLGVNLCGGALLCVAFFLGSLGVLGLATAGLLQRLTPDLQDLVAPLYFDYSKGPTVDAVIDLLSLHRPPPQKRARVSWAGRGLDMWVNMQLPQTTENCEVFVVTVELANSAGAVVISETRPAMLHCRPAIVQNIYAFCSIPLMGLWNTEARRLSMLVITDYKELKEDHVASARVIVKGRAGKLAPQLYSAALHVHLRLGWMTQLMYFVRSHTILFLFVLSAAVASLVAGGCCALVGLGALVAMNSSPAYLSIATAHTAPAGSDTMPDTASDADFGAPGDSSREVRHSSGQQSPALSSTESPLAGLGTSDDGADEAETSSAVSGLRRRQLHRSPSYSSYS